MIFVYIGVASVVVSLLMLWGVDWLVTKQRGKSGVAEALTEAPVRPAYLRWLIPSLLAFLVAGGVYLAIPSAEKALPTSGNQDVAKMSGPEHASQGGAAGDMNAAAKKLADKMANDPNNGEGWLLLAMTYAEMGRHAEADAAFEKASALVSLSPSALADWADAHAMTNNRLWDAAGRDMVKRALAADPRHVKALALAGSEAFDRGDYKAAIDFWQRMKAVAVAGTIFANVADGNIAEAHALLAGKKLSAKTEPAVVAGAVAGVVTLNPKLQGKVSAEDTVFVSAKAPDGKGPPLAVWRYKGSDFPIEFRLDDSSAIMPGRTISQFSEVLVTAKVSKSGSAEPTKGDILATPVKARLGNMTLVVELNSER